MRKILKKIPLIGKFFISKTFSETLNFKAELKEYKKFCKGKSIKYKYYCQWEKHIKQCITANLKTTIQLYNFKHFCAIKRDSIQNLSFTGTSILIATISAILSLFLNDSLKSVTESFECTIKKSFIDSLPPSFIGILSPFVSLIMITLVVIISVSYVVRFNYSSSLETSFYTNLIKITESCEKKLQGSRTIKGGNHDIHRRYLRTSRHRTL